MFVVVFGVFGLGKIIMIVELVVEWIVVVDCGGRGWFVDFLLVLVFFWVVVICLCDWLVL